MIIVQMTDTHVAEPGNLPFGGIDTAARLETVVSHINGLDPRPDAVVVTGDLVNSGTAAEYELFIGIMAELSCPYYPIPGNHDSRPGFLDAFSRVGPMPRSGSSHADYVVEDHDVRLIALDTSIPGEAGGRLEPEQLDWLDTTLESRSDANTLVLMHHPPFATGISWIDGSTLEDPHHLERVIERHDQVGALLCGHIHRTIHTSFGGTTAMVCSSTAMQAGLALGHENQHTMIDEPAAVAIHVWPATGRLVSHRSVVDPGVDLIGPPGANHLTE